MTDIDPTPHAGDGRTRDGEEAVDALVERASDEDEAVRWSAVVEIARLAEDERAGPRLLDLLRDRTWHDPSERIRSAAGEVLDDLG